jgi:hypothetical protein
MLEQYYTGDLYLGVVNGIDDGSVLYCIMCLVTAYYGSMEFWGEKFTVFEGYGEMQMIYWISLALLLPIIITNITCFYRIFSHRKSAHFKKFYTDAFSFIVHVLIYPINSLIFYLAIYYSPTKIFSTHPRTVMLGWCFLNTLYTHRMQYLFVTEEFYNPIRRTVLFAWALLIPQIVSA